ncbi:MAG: glutathione S-transferase family protein [Myxococcota bacterium]
MAERRSRGTLHGVIFVPYVRKVRAVLALKAIPYRLVSVMPGAMDAAFFAKSPLAKVPVWEEEGFLLPDSSAICAYLERIAPEPAVYPGDPRAFASTLFWEEYADSRLVEACEPIFFQRVVRPRVLRQATDESIVRRYVEEVIPPVLDQIETLYCAPGPLNAACVPPAGRRVPASEPADVASIALWSPLVNLEHVGVAIDPERWPGVAALVAVLNGHPALEPIVAEERAALGAG